MSEGSQKLYEKLFPKNIKEPTPSLRSAATGFNSKFLTKINFFFFFKCCLSDLTEKLKKVNHLSAEDFQWQRFLRKNGNNWVSKVAAVYGL